MKTYMLISAILTSLLLTACGDDEVINDIIKNCGSYSNPERYYDTEVLESKFQENIQLDINFGNDGYARNFSKNDGDSLVFHFIRYFRGEAQDLYYEFHLLFQVPDNAEELYISSKEFKKYNVFFRSHSYGSEHGFLTYETGCIQIEKIKDDQYSVDVNLTYNNYPGLRNNVIETKNLTFSDTFIKGTSYQDPGMAMGND